MKKTDIENENVMGTEETSAPAEDNKPVSEQVEEALDDMTTGTILTLRRPVMYNGEEIKELSFDFNKLTGDDAFNINAELEAIGKQVIVPSSSVDFLIRVARNACNKPVGVDFFKQISIVDFTKIQNRARFFLLGLAI